MEVESVKFQWGVIIICCQLAWLHIPRSGGQPNQTDKLTYTQCVVSVMKLTLLTGESLSCTKLPGTADCCLFCYGWVLSSFAWWPKSTYIAFGFNEYWHLLDLFSWLYLVCLIESWLINSTRCKYLYDTDLGSSSKMALDSHLGSILHHTESVYILIANHAPWMTRYTSSVASYFLHRECLWLVRN